MKAYIGWSGEKSREVAGILKTWIPLVVPNVQTLSANDIPPGTTNWVYSLLEQLRTADCGLLCITKDNVNSPWLLYEAGVLSAGRDGVDRGAVIPFLLDVGPSELSGPLQHFQTVTAERNEVWRMTQTLSRLCGESPDTERSRGRIFDAMYPHLLDALNRLCASKDDSNASNTIPRKNVDSEASLRKDVYGLKHDMMDVNRKLDTLLSELSGLKTTASKFNSPNMLPANLPNASL